MPDLNRVKTGQYAQTPPRVVEHLFNAGIYTESVFKHALRKYDKLDIITYSISRDVPAKAIDRLIYVVGLLPRTLQPPRQISGSHTKLWIGYVKNKVIDIFIGSANATDMTISDLVVKLQPSQHKPALEYFNTIWNQLK